MNTESGAHAVAPINFLPLQVSAAPAIVNCAVFSTGIIGTGLAFSLYVILKGGRHERNAYNPFTPAPPVHWLGEIDWSPDCLQLTPPCRVPRRRRRLCPAGDGLVHRR